MRKIDNTQQRIFGRTMGARVTERPVFSSRSAETNLDKMAQVFGRALNVIDDGVKRNIAEAKREEKEAELVRRRAASNRADAELVALNQFCQDSDVNFPGGNDASGYADKVSQQYESKLNEAAARISQIDPETAADFRTRATSLGNRYGAAFRRRENDQMRKYAVDLQGTLTKQAVENFSLTGDATDLENAVGHFDKRYLAATGEAYTPLEKLRIFKEAFAKGELVFGSETYKIVGEDELAKHPRTAGKKYITRERANEMQKELEEAAKAYQGQRAAIVNGAHAKMIDSYIKRGEVHKAREYFDKVQNTFSEELRMSEGVSAKVEKLLGGYEQSEILKSDIKAIIDETSANYVGASQAEEVLAVQRTLKEYVDDAPEELKDEARKRATVAYNEYAQATRLHDASVAQQFWSEYEKLDDVGRIGYLESILENPDSNRVAHALAQKEKVKIDKFAKKEEEKEQKEKQDRERPAVVEEFRVAFSGGGKLQVDIEGNYAEYDLTKLDEPGLEHLMSTMQLDDKTKKEVRTLFGKRKDLLKEGEVYGVAARLLGVSQSKAGDLLPDLLGYVEGMRGTLIFKDDGDRKKWVADTVKNIMETDVVHVGKMWNTNYDTIPDALKGRGGNLDRVRMPVGSWKTLFDEQDKLNKSYGGASAANRGTVEEGVTKWLEVPGTL